MLVKVSNILEKEVNILLKDSLVSIRKYIGNIFSEYGKYDLAIDMYFKALRLGPRRYDVYFSLGKTLFSMGNEEDSIRFFKKSLEVDKHNPIYQHWLHMAETQKKRFRTRQIYNIY